MRVSWWCGQRCGIHRHVALLALARRTVAVSGFVRLQVMAPNEKNSSRRCDVCGCDVPSNDRGWGVHVEGVCECGQRGTQDLYCTDPALCTMLGTHVQVSATAAACWACSCMAAQTPWCSASLRTPPWQQPQRPWRPPAGTAAATLRAAPVRLPQPGSRLTAMGSGGAMRRPEAAAGRRTQQSGTQPSRRPPGHCAPHWSCSRCACLAA